MKGFMKVCSSGSAMWKGWIGIGLPRKCTLVVVHWVGHGRDRFFTVKECLRKRGLDVRQLRRMVQDRSEWLGLVRG